MYPSRAVYLGGFLGSFRDGRNCPRGAFGVGSQGSLELERMHADGEDLKRLERSIEEFDFVKASKVLSRIAEHLTFDLRRG